MYRHGEAEIEAAVEVLRSGEWFRFGEPTPGRLKQAATFEQEWCSAFGVKHAGFVSNGTSALMCCYAGLQVGPGDEVIVPGYTWIASATSPLSMGAIPVIVDVDESLGIDPAAVEAAITPRTKAICPVHMAGLSCDMERLMEVAERHQLYVVEDTCQCDGGIWCDDRKLGTIGHMGGYSFNFYKVISCGDGGLFSTDNDEFYDRAMIFHDAGIGFRPHAESLGVPIFGGLNLRGSEILAAVMRPQLDRLGGIVVDLHSVHQMVSEQIEGAPGVKPIPYNGSPGVGTQTGTAATIGLRFDTEDQTRAFAREFAKHLPEPIASASLPIDSGRHVYANWEAVMKRRVWHVDAMNPYRHPANAECGQDYSPDMLPRTLGILRTTAMIAVKPDWGNTESEHVADAIKAAAAAV